MSIYLIDYENVHESGLSGIKDLPSGDRVIVFYGDKIKSISFDVHVQMMNSRAAVEFIETHKTAKNYLDFQLATYLGYLIGGGSKDSVVIVSHDTGFDSVVDFWKERGTDICRRELISVQQPAAPAATQEKSTKSTAKKSGSSQKSGKNSTQKSKASSEESQKSRPALAPVKPAADLASDEEEPAKTEIPAASDSSGNEKSPKARENKQDAQKKPDLPEAYRKKVRAVLRSDKLSSGNYTTIYRAISGSKDKLSLNNTLVKAYGSEKGGEVYNRIRDIFAEYQASASVQH